MFSKVVLVALASCALAMPQAPDAAPSAAPAPDAAPAPAPAAVAGGPAPISINKCNTSQASCCQSTRSGTDSGATSLLGLLGLVVKDVTLLIGIDCTPLAIVGVLGGPNCAQQPVCCENNNFNGLINIGCTPISA